MTTSTIAPTSPIPGAEARTLEVPGATLTYDVRRSEGTTEPPLVLIGSPMGAGGFPSLASHFLDRTIVTYDPRNNGERSPADDPAVPITAEVQADDVHRVIQGVGGGKSTSSRAAAEPSWRWRSSRSTQTTFGQRWRTSRPSRRSCRTGSTRSLRVRRSTRRITGAAVEPAWRTSSRS
jgi:pimeloyl-ACP methyl ester carboxylesterase